MARTLDKVGVNLVYRIGSTAIYKKIFRYWYPYMTSRLSNADDVVFLNWGYEQDPPMGIPLSAEDEPNRYSIQLYHQVGTQVDLAGKKVLEISCGHGGGSSYLTRTQKPASYTGLDFNAKGVEFCKRRHADVEGLDFVHGDAENLPFADASFDAVVNVEASHIYPHFDKFIAQVTRVLKPGGHFLHTDFRNRDNFGEWDSVLANSGMRIVNKRDISADVLRGLTLNSAHSHDLIDRHLTNPLVRRFAQEFTVVEGSLFYKDLETRDIEYRTYCLQKD